MTTWPPVPRRCRPRCWHSPCRAGSGEQLPLLRRRSFLVAPAVLGDESEKFAGAGVAPRGCVAGERRADLGRREERPQELLGWFAAEGVVGGDVERGKVGHVRLQPETEGAGGATHIYVT